MYIILFYIENNHRNAIRNGESGGASSAHPGKREKQKYLSDNQEYNEFISYDLNEKQIVLENINNDQKDYHLDS